MHKDMKKKSNIVMFNYYGMCDSSGAADGHTVKVTNEYAQLLWEVVDIELVASPCIVYAAKQDYFIRISSLKYNISINGNSLFKRIVDKYKLIYNIHQAVKQSKTCLFYQVDFFFFLYVFLFYRKCKESRILCLIYHQDFTNRIFKGLFAYVYNAA